MAAELIGGAFLSSLFQTLFDNLNCPDFRNFFIENQLSEGPLQKLKTRLLFANQLHHAAEEKLFVNPDVREWISELKDAICAAEDSLDIINYATLQNKSEAEASGIVRRMAKRLKREFTSSSKSLDDAVLEMHKKLEDIMSWQDLYGIKVDVDKKIRTRLPAPLADESKVFGRNDAKETIISRLLLDNSTGDEITVIPIVGMGGVGKTTLDQLVYEDDRVKRHFTNIRAWVNVSDDFDILKIMRKFFMDITDKECNSYDVIQLSLKLRGELKGKKFIIVLDDVWNEDYCTWDSLKSHLVSLGARGSKIIITTRSNGVASVMANVEPYDLKGLSNGDCWSLFKEHVFGNANSDLSKDLHEIGRKIVRKCDGLPLAVKALAGLLRSLKEQEEWLKILKSEIWQLQLEGKTRNNILPSLWLSYNSLPPHLKHCFAYFSIFPKGFQITEYEKEKIVLLWMAVRFLKPDLRGREAIQAGYNYFEELRSMSLLQQSSYNSTILIMHDCVHDLAAFLSGEFCFSLGDNKKTKLTGRTHHFSYSRAKEYHNFGDVVVAKHLRTCLQVPSTMNYMSLQQKEPIMPNGEFLRALCLSKAHLLVFPTSVCNSKLLGYLDLSWNDFEQVPKIICSLHNLQTLRLSYCEKLTELPADLGRLDKLCCLDIEGVPLRKMPPQIGKLKDLVTLSQFVLGKNDCSSIKELRELCDLSGKLAIKNLQNVDDVEDVKVANLQAKKYLDKIEYHWSSGDEAGYSDKEKLVLDALQPNKNVEDIVFSGYSGEKFSEWVVNPYANIATVSISNYKSCFLPPLGQLPCLEKLSIAQCNKVTDIGPEFYHESHSRIEPFRSLKVLEFKDMLKWTTWSFIKDGCFLNLEKLSIQHCPNLNIYFPYCFPSLKTLFIKDTEQIFQFLPETRKIDEAFPSLKTMSMENCPRILESSQFWKSFSNIKYLDFNSYRKDTIYWNANERFMLSIEKCKNMVSLPKADISTVTYIEIKGLENLEALGCEDFQHFTSLKMLTIYDCRKLCRFPGEMLPTSMTYLEIMRLPSLQDVGNGFQHLTSLKDLTVENCKDLQFFRGEMLPTSLSNLKIRELPNIKNVGQGFQHLTSLKDLEVKDCKDLQCLTGEMLPTTLSSLKITELPNVKDLGEGFQHLTSLEDLTLEGLECFNIEMLPKSLTKLSISNLPNFEELVEGFQHLTSLRRLEIEGIKNMSCFAVEMLPKSLTSLEISDTTCLTCLQQWLPTSLTSLNIRGLQNLKYLCESSRDLISLKTLSICNCENLELLAREDGNGFQDFTSLEYLSIHNWEKLPLLLEKGLPTTLTSLFFWNFENLEDLNLWEFNTSSNLRDCISCIARICVACLKRGCPNVFQLCISLDVLC